MFFAGAWGLWNIVRGIIYLIRAQSGDEHYAKCVEDVMDKYERKQDDGYQRSDWQLENLKGAGNWVPGSGKSVRQLPAPSTQNPK